MINIRKSTVLPMLDLLEQLEDGIDIRSSLTELLNHEDYKIELERYKEHIKEEMRFDKDEAVDFILNIKDHSQLKSKALEYRKDDLIHIMKNINHYREVYRGLQHISLRSVEESLNMTRYGLPHGYCPEDIDIIISIGLGSSQGWFYNNSSHYDLKLIIENMSNESFLNTIAHETHHIGCNEYMKDLSEEDIAKCPQGSLFIYLSGEGTAIKFCNNFKGRLTDKLYSEKPMDMDGESYDYYMSNFDSIYEQFREDIRYLKSCTGDPNQELIEIFMKHYFNSEQNLLQPLCYSLGADIWGLIHDYYGTKKMFELLKQPSQLIEAFNKALVWKGLHNLIIK